MKFLTITDLGTIEFVNDLNYIVSAGISARDVYSTFRAERRAVVTPEPRAPWRRVPTGSARGEHCVTPARAAEKETRGAPGLGGGGITSDFKWQGWSKDLLGFEIFDFGIFWGEGGRKILASIRSPSLASSYKFLLFSGFSRSLEIFYGSEISHGILLGLNFFGPGIFWVLFEALRIFFQFFIFPSFDRPCHHLCHLNPE